MITTEVSLGEEIIAWIEAECRCPEGALVGERLQLMPWQRDLILRVYNNPMTTRRAIISVARKNGKSCFAACLLLVHLVGPMAVANSQLYSCAQSRDQASLLYSLASKIIRMSPTLSNQIVCRDGTKVLHCPTRGTTYRALSSDANTAYGLSPAFVVHDELGVTRGPRNELYEALETASAAQASPLSLIISTQAPGDQDLLSILIDDAMSGVDPRVVCSLFTAPTHLDPFGVEAIRAANPSFGVCQNPEETLAMSRDAQRMPSRMAAYENLILNRRVEASAPFVTPQQWQACGGEPFNLTGREVYGGLDLSETKDLTALVLISQDIRDGVWHVAPTFWLPAQGLHDRARVDRVPYDRWHEDGYLETTPGASISYEFVAHYLRQIFDQHRVVRLAFDRWNMVHLKPWLLAAGFTESLIEEKFIGFGQGYKSMSPALRDLESVILERKLHHGGHPVLQMCASNAVIERDPAGNRKLSKKRSTGRIDGMTALLMAIGVVPIQTPVKFDAEALIV